ncbi:hypothetical protein SteCoe_7709 [Stentor coeruleus]|uniref:Uncharacterized protein n=1 Tax=Stentor coeruleus TaxID=5963 RepID=A0A1R2CLY2_9CILI|nr:hypothetical protein SteCoe_7709 [Stentor coeruleus]
MLNSQDYSDEARGYNSHHISRALSPMISGLRPVPRLADPISSSYLLPKDNEKINIPDFINSIQNQLKRLTPTFSFQYATDSPLSQAINFLTQAIDHILAERDIDPKSFIEQNDEFFDYQQSRRFKEEAEKAKETTKALGRYEQLLKKKEEKLKEEKSKIQNDKNKLKNREEQLQAGFNDLDYREKNFIENKRFDQEKIKLDKEDAERKLNEAKDMKEKVERKIDESTKHLRYEKESLMQLENCLNQTKQALAIDQKRITQDKLEIEKEKWKLEQRARKLEEQEILLNVKIEHMDQEKQVFESEKVGLLSLRKEMEEERNDMMIFKGQMMGYDRDSRMSRKSPLDDFPNTEGRFETLGQEYEAKFLELEEREIEIEQAYKDLNDQMGKCNKELEERESALDEREFYIEKQEKDFKKTFENLKSIEISLAESKIQVEDLRTFTIPELENQSETLGKLIQELKNQKFELENLVEKMQNKVSSVWGSPNLSDTSEQLSFCNDKNSPNPQLNQEIIYIATELEDKLLAIRNRELELDHAQELLQNDRENLAQAAEYIKISHVEVEEKRKKLEEDLAEEKAKLTNQYLKLESGMKLLSTKESEIFAFKRKLDEKQKMLMIKEKEIMMRDKNTHSHSSSIIEEN